MKRLPKIEMAEFLKANGFKKEGEIVRKFIGIFVKYFEKDKNIIIQEDVEINGIKREVVLKNVA